MRTAIINENPDYHSVGLLALDFDGVLTDNAVYVDQNGTETVRCYRGDGIGIENLKSLGVAVAVISSESNPVVKARADKLGILCVQAVKHKGIEIVKLCHQVSVSPENTIFLGNDINDIPAFEVVGIPIGVADSHPDIHAHVVRLTRRNGGVGAVRELCDEIYSAKVRNRREAV